MKVLISLLLSVVLSSCGGGKSDGEVISDDGIDVSESVTTSEDTDVNGFVQIKISEDILLEIEVLEEETNAPVQNVRIYATELDSGIFLWSESLDEYYHPSTRFVTRQELLAKSDRIISAAPAVPAYIGWY